MPRLLDALARGAKVSKVTHTSNNEHHHIFVTAGKQAQLYVPRLLDALAGGAAPEAAFAARWRGVPLAAFLPWSPSMLSLLGELQGEALLPALEVYHP